MVPLLPTDCIIHPNGTIYHLGLTPNQVPNHIILVGDPERVNEVGRYFDKISYTTSHREFHSCLGSIGSHEILVLSTGIGADNIDIVLNELHLCANLNFETRTFHPQHRALNIIRIGTSGTVQTEISPGTILYSEYAIGFDPLPDFYEKMDSCFSTELHYQIQSYLKDHRIALNSYAVQCDVNMLNRLSSQEIRGITCTMPGFYGPQSRNLQVNCRYPDLPEILSLFKYENISITNIEMETAAIYFMSKLLGHHAVSINVILANRRTGIFSSQPKQDILKGIDSTLQRLFR